MTVPVLGTLSLSGFQHGWFFLYAVVAAAVLAGYVGVQFARQQRILRSPTSRNRAVVMLVIDVSESMAATDVTPTRLAAAKQAGKAFADELTPGINLGLVAFAGTASVLVQPTTNRDVMKAAIDTLHTAERTATGEGVLTALQAIATADGVIGGGDGPPPARIVLESDGKQTVPANPDDPRGAFSAAQAAKDSRRSPSARPMGLSAWRVSTFRFPSTTPP